MRPWWIETITLDEDGEVVGITAVIDAPYLPLVQRGCAEGGEVEVIRRERGDTELWVRLSTAQFMALFHQQGEARAQADLIPDCYVSLTWVVYGLMEKD